MVPLGALLLMGRGGTAVWRRQRGSRNKPEAQIANGARIKFLSYLLSQVTPLVVDQRGKRGNFFVFERGVLVCDVFIPGHAHSEWLARPHCQFYMRAVPLSHTSRDAIRVLHRRGEGAHVLGVHRAPAVAGRQLR